MNKDMKDLDVSTTEMQMLKEIQAVQEDPDRRRHLACEQGATRLAKAIFGQPGEGKLSPRDDRSQHVAALLRSGLVEYINPDGNVARYRVSARGERLIKQLLPA